MKSISTFFVPLLLCTSCLDQIDLPVDPGFEETIIIEGKIVKSQPSRVLVSIRRLFDFAPDSRKSLFAPEILVRDDSGNSFPLQLTAAETYTAEIPENHPSFKVDYYKSYQIDAQLSDGRRFVSEFEQLLPVPRITDIRAIRSQKYVPDRIQEFALDDFVKFLITTPLHNDAQPGNIRLRWEFERTFALTDNPPPYLPDFRKTCYITEIAGLFNPQAFDGSFLTTNVLEEHPLIEEQVNHHFAEGYVLHTYQESLTESAFQYWEEVRGSVLRTGDMFEAAPGRIRTNLRNIDRPDNRIGGFFYATEVDTLRVYVDPSFVDFPDTLCIPPLPFPPIECVDCLLAPRSTLVKPGYWPK